MKLFLLAAAAAILTAAWTTGPLRAEEHLPARHHVVAVGQVRAIEGVRHATWACQRTIGAQATRAALSRSELRAAGWRYLLWVKARWQTRFAGCDAERDHRSAIVRRLQAGLAGYPLAEWAARFEAAGRRWNVSPYLMAAISGTESTFGLYVTPGNAWGIGPGKYFPDFGEGIDYLAWLLATRYPIDSGDLTRVGSIYAACGSCWGSTTGSIMQSRFGASPYALTYPRRE